MYVPCVICKALFSKIVKIPIFINTLNICEEVNSCKKIYNIKLKIR